MDDDDVTQCRWFNKGRCMNTGEWCDGYTLDCAEAEDFDDCNPIDQIIDF